MADTGAVLPLEAPMVQRLVKYWVNGPGADLIGWGTPDDFDRCVAQIQRATRCGDVNSVPGYMIKGLCTNLHRAANSGRYPWEDDAND